MFTGSFYLSKTTIWGATWGDIPNESYERIGFLLGQEERKELLGDDQTHPGIKDGWWNASDIDSLSHFFKSVYLTETRFLSQPNLFLNVSNSVDSQILATLSSGVIDIVNAGSYQSKSYEYIPLKSLDRIPVEWFKAAEEVIREKNAILNENTVKRLAGDAFRQNLLS